MRARLLLLALVAFVGCQRPLVSDVGCFADANCPDGSVCGDDKFCHLGTHSPHLTCVANGTSQQCTCDAGYASDGAGGCKDVDECAVEGACGPNTRCTNSDGAFTCACLAFFKDGGELGCVDIDECETNRGGCDANATCTNVIGGAPTCECGAFWTGDGKTCVDKDECNSPSNPCSFFAVCSNRDGVSPLCECMDGFTGNGFLCTDIDECATGADSCGPNTTCSNHDGDYECLCDFGYEADPSSPHLCVDINECAATNPCAEGSTCVNTDGNFRCQCPDGFEPPEEGSLECVDIDECTRGLDDCGAGTGCRNVTGGFECDCLPGFERSTATSCADVDECTRNTDNCAGSATCVNDPGGFRCTCPAGYEPDPATPGSCRDVDECATANGGCDTHATCSNRTGQLPTCACSSGYTGDGRSCTDVDECLSDNGGCSPFATCGNNAGAAPTCTCNQGLSGDGITCRATWTQVSAGSSHTCAIRTGGALFCWGENEVGQLGDGTVLPSALPRPVGSALAPWLSVSAGDGFTCARSGNGNVAGALYCWGYNAQGQLGNGLTDITVTSPTRVGTASDWSAVSAGSQHACGLRGTSAAAHLWCWGANDSAQLGLGTVQTPKRTPQDVVIDVGVKAISAGGSSTCAIGPEGNVWCWGDNSRGQVGDPAFTRHDTPRQLPIPNATGVSTGLQHACATAAVTGGIGLFCWGQGPLGTAQGGWLGISDTPLRVGSGSGWISVSAGFGTFSLALGPNRVPYGWGENKRGEAGVGHVSAVGAPQSIASSGGWTSLSAGRRHACGIDAAGVLSCWGSQDQGALASGRRGAAFTPRRIDSRQDWKSVHSTAISSATCAIRNDDSLWCWGDNSTFVAGDVDASAVQAPLARLAGLAVRTVSPGTFLGCAIDSSQALWCWGSTIYGLSGPMGNVPRVVSRVGTDNDWSRISVGESSACGVRSVGDGQLQCWGRNGVNSNLANGRNGTGTESNLEVVTSTAPGTVGVREVFQASDHGCALVEVMPGVREVRCWGANQSGQAGGGSVVQVVGSPTAVSVSAPTLLASGPNLTLAATAGQLYAWGPCQYRQCGSTSGTRAAPVSLFAASLKSLAVGQTHACFVKTDGTLWCWGGNTSGQLGSGAAGDATAALRQVGTATDWRDVTAGHSHSCATKSDGSLWCWGSNADGQLGDGQSWLSAPTPGAF